MGNSNFWVGVELGKKMGKKEVRVSFYFFCLFDFLTVCGNWARVKVLGWAWVVIIMEWACVLWISK